MISRILHSVKNRFGRSLNHVLPPKPEILPGNLLRDSVVAFVSMKWDYRSRLNGNGYEYKRFIPAFQELFRSVHFVPLEFQKGIVPALRSIPTRPLLVISVFQSMKDIPDGYFDLKSEGFFLANWYTDDDMQFARFSLNVANKFDLNLTTFEPAMAWYRAIGARAYLAQWGGVAGVQFLEQRKYLAAFIGRMYNERKELMRLLKQKFGQQVFVHDSLVDNISEAEMFSIYQNSWISIDEPVSFDKKNIQIKARVFETASFGCVVATKPIDRLSRYYEVGKEVIFYKSFNELISIIQECQDNTPKYRELARQAYFRAQREHLYVHRFGEILSHIRSLR